MNRPVPPNAPLMRARNINFGPDGMIRVMDWQQRAIRLVYIENVNDNRKINVNIPNSGERTDGSRMMR